MDTTRITGLASGMDTESIVSGLMKAERVKVDKLFQKQQTTLWKQEQYNEVNKDFANFILDTKKDLELSKSLSNGMLIGNSISNLNWVKKVSSSDEDVLTAKASAIGMTGVHKIKVNNLAEGVSAVSTNAVKVGENNATNENTLLDLGMDVEGTQTIKFQIIKEDGSTDTVSVDYTKDTKIKDLIKEINYATTDDGDPKTSETALGIQANFDETAGRLFLSTKKTGSKAQIKIIEDENGILTGANNKFNMMPSLGSTAESVDVVKAGVTDATTLADLGVSTDGILNLNIGGTSKDITVNKENTIQELVNKINEEFRKNPPDPSILPIGKTVVSFSDGKLVFDTKDITTENKLITVENDAQGLFTGKNIFKMPTLLGGRTGTDASINFDGAENLEYSSNTINLNGIELNLKDTSTDKDITIKVDTDVDKVYEKIKGFVDKYNEMIDKMNKKVSEKRYRDYTPLTTEQKKSMKEDDIKLWEQRAKSGLLRNDQFISEILTDARTGLYEDVEGVTSKYNQLTTIGITTDKWKSKGKLVINEKKLKDAIMDDVEGTLNLLFKSPSNEDKVTLETELRENWKTSTGKTYDDYANFTASEKREYTIAYDKKVRSNTGLINRLYDDMTDGMKKIIDKAGPGDDKELYRNVKSDMLIDFVTGGNGRKGSISLLDEDFLDYGKKIKDEESRLARLEQSYWKKYTAMETAMNKMNQQSSWLAGQLSKM
ncbi:flagellar filament capping protein FliD [Crassaminicella profunda]|uniref:flagellar filament capping protein FliD n=1 Tax=Crassaminicella profunda TaxID=1286698 RepID=UPI001CA79105|nr:flagellar filament capping protein FliD [Crassaminicella profunda]QZY54291.1 flagellar filament capping protein FliD [Crassaminicella profunda]